MHARSPSVNKSCLFLVSLIEGPIPAKLEFPVKTTGNSDIAWMPVCIDVMVFGIYRRVTQRLSKGNANEAEKT